MKIFRNRHLWIICSVIVFILIVAAFVKATPDISGNGRKFCLTLPEGLIIQASPPKEKLVQFMNKKYGVKFKQYLGEEFSEYGFRYAHYYSAESFNRYKNGIIVSTNEYPGHYFFVCDYYGVIHDDYGCHKAEPEAEQILGNELADVINSNFKVILHPNCMQEHIFSENPSGQDYLENGDYIIKIFISGNGKNSKDQFKEISRIVAPYWNDQCYMYLYYVNESTLDTISSYNYESYSGKIPYKKMGQGWGYDDSSMIKKWEWISN